MQGYSFIITGRKDAGKSTLCWQILEYLNQQPVSIGGVITLQNDKKWFYLVAEKSKIPFEASEIDEYIPIGDYHVHKINLKYAINSIKKGLDSDFLFIDEIGPLELQGSGYFPILDSVLSREQGNILVIRETILNEFLSMYPLIKKYRLIKVESHETLSPLNFFKNMITQTSNDSQKI
ncbi:MAG: nucleoside-triphosphatase [Promethearchaeota archaeon]